MQESLADTKEIHEVPAGGTPMVHWINIYGDHTLRISFKRRYAKHDEDTPDSAKHRSQSQLISGNLYCTGNNIIYPIYCPGLGSTTSPSTTSAPSPVSIGRHFLHIIDDGRNFECVNCKLVAPDFETLHTVPCAYAAQMELDEQRKKLEKLKRLRQLESVLKAKSDQLLLPQAPVKVDVPESSVAAPSPNLIPVRATMLSERKFPEQLKNHALLGFVWD